MQLNHSIRNRTTTRSRVTDRRGSTLLVVIGLMGLLALLGFVFYTFASQEQLNASFYAEGAQGSEPDLDFFDWGLEQLIVGPRDGLKNSVLWGRRHAMLTNQFGSDLHPHNGRGLNLINASNPQIDQNFDGAADVLVDNNANGIHDSLEIVDSPVAWNNNQRLDFQSIPTADVDYTYPDINNCFLGYKGKLTEDGTTALLIPSFLRPQILRNGAGPIWDWSTNPSTAARSFRPHPSHLHKLLPTSVGAPKKRFLDDSVPADVAIITTLPATGAAGKGFPFKVDTNGNGANNEIGVWSPTGGAVTYELDVDTDGDGINDAIWMDLDHGMLENAAGVKYVPLWAFQVLDADGLFDLNTHGQIDRNVTIPGPAATPFGGANKYLHKSNLGVGPIEVNPSWGLNTDPRGADHIAGTADDIATLSPLALQQYFRFFGRNPADPIEAANMEMVFLKAGRVELSAAGFPAASASVTNLFTGVFGEGDLLYRWITTGNAPATTYPKPGYTKFTGQSMQSDDNYDQYAQEGDPSNLPFGHPLDMLGTGSFLLAGNPKVANLFAPLGGANPSQWLQYIGYHSQGNIPYYFYTNGAPFTQPLLSTMPTFQPLIDDGTELILEPGAAQKPADEVLGPEEMAHLHLSDTVLGKVTHSKRLENLMPLSMSVAAGISNPDLRQRFTTRSFTRRNHSITEVPSLTNSHDATYADGNSDGKVEFPLQYTPFGTAKAYGPEDAFRVQTRRLLETEYGNITKQKPQMRLSVNGVLDVERNPGVQVNLATGRLGIRPLTAHPIGLPATALPITWTSTTPATYPPTTAQEQEWWARYDRQVLARDVYVLLYSLGSGANVPPNTSNARGLLKGKGKKKGILKKFYYRPLFSEERLEEMAQFAVNLVDALDRDNVVTRFEFDLDLSNGWNLDDNPADGTDGGTDRATVFGIESQQLTFSEALAIFTGQVKPPGSGADHAATEWNDSKDRYFTYFELRNASPFAVDISRGQWEIAVRPNPATEDYSVPNATERRLRLRKPAGAIGPGGLFTIGSTNDSTVTDTIGSGNPYSQFKVDPAWTSGMASFQKIVPASGNLDLDLIRDTTGSQFEIRDGAGGNLTAVPGSLMTSTTIADPNNPVDLVLVRRQDIFRAAPTTPAEENDNPWVPVDFLRLPSLQRFDLTATSTATAAPKIPDELSNLTARERPEPLLGNFETTFAGAGNIRNTLGANNLNTTGAFSQWQAHFDRDFASAGELLSVPLYGPGTLTQEHWESRTPLVVRALSDPNATPLMATDLLMFPNYPDALVTADVNGDGAFNVTDQEVMDNRWYRLLEFIEVPTRMHRSLANNPLDLVREPGRINMNTLRHPEVLAGLIDDVDVLSRTLTAGASHLPDKFEAGRDWWTQFIRARDGVTVGAVSTAADPITGRYLPGLAGSHPFRSFHFKSRGNPSIEDTLLRSLPLDGSPIGRRLFELDTLAEYGSGAIDHPVRHRLLSKVFNSTTQRSNVFIVYVTVGFFEAYKVPVTGEVRIGAKLPAAQNLPDQKGFFIVDRSYAEEAFDRGQFSFAKWRELIKLSMKNY